MNTNELGLGAPSLPDAILLGVTALTAMLMLFFMVNVRSRTGAFVMGAAWLRYIMSAFHTVTYRPFVAGMSANALGSIAMFGVGLLTINWRNLALRFLFPFYVLIAIAILSALVNGQAVLSGLITVLTKYGYVIVITISVYEAMRKSKDGSFMASMLWAFLPAFIFQAFSIALGISKHTETDANAVSFIGGYNHEAAFSVVLATCLTVACFAEKLNKQIRTGIVLVCLVGIFFANYRTTLVAIAPLLVAYFAFSSLRRFPVRDRPFVVSALIVFSSIVFGILALALADRFQDVNIAAAGDVNFFKPPDQYSVDETRLLSGRPHIWSMYIYGWMLGDPLNQVIGFGPESWSGVFPLYAHNTLVNYLYEYGLVGVAGALFLWFSMLAAALRVRHPQRGVLIGAHASYLLLNMATMPMWMVEGNLLYGVICGYTLYLLSLQAPASRRAAAA